MAFDIGELRGTISLNDQFSGPVEKVASTLGLAGKSFGAVAGLAGIATSAIAGATAAIVMLGQRGAAVADVQGAFDNLTTAAGSTADEMLGALQQGTLGTISNFDLMAKANAVLGSGMIKTSDDMGTLAAGAKMLADRTGGDTAEAFDTLTGAMASGRVATLKQMGVFVDTKGAIQAYANALGISVDKLTAEQRAEAISTATLAALKDQLAAAGPATADFGDQIDRGKVAIANFTDNLAVAVAQNPVVAAGMNAVGEAFKGAFGGDQTDLIKTLMGYVADFAIGLTYVAQTAVMVAGGFVQAWYLMKTVVLGVITAVSGFATALVTIVTGLAEMAMKVPGASAVVGDLAAGARALQADMTAVTLSLAAETAEAARGAAGHSELSKQLDVVGGAIINVRDRMEEAKSKIGDATVTVVNLKKPVEDVGAALTLTAEELRKLTEATQAALDEQQVMWQEGADFEKQLMSEIALLRTTGLQQQLLEIQIAQDEELAKLQAMTLMTVDEYAIREALVREKYGLMTAAAKGHFASVELAAAAAGFKTRDELQATADNAKKLYDEMLASGKFTFSELQRAHKAWKDAEAAMDEEGAIGAIEKFNIIASAAKTILSAIFGGSKAAAIAISLIDTAQAVVKALASAPPPFNYVLAGAVGVAGLIQTNKIRSVQPAGYALGTPDTMFQDFGRVSTVDLHGPEAIVTPKQGASVAGMVEEALAIRDTRTVEEIRGLREDLAADRRRLPIAMRDAMLLAGA